MANPEESDKEEVFAMNINGFYRNAAVLPEARTLR